MNIREIGIDVSNRIRLAQDLAKWRAFVSTVMNLRVPLKKAGYCLTSCVTISFS